MILLFLLLSLFSAVSPDPSTTTNTTNSDSTLPPILFKVDPGLPWNTYCWIFDSKTNPTRTRSSSTQKYCETRYTEAENGTFHVQSLPFRYHFDKDDDVDAELEKGGKALMERVVNGTEGVEFLQFICRGSGCNGNLKTPEFFRGFHAKWVEWSRNDALEIKEEVAEE